MPEPEDPMEDVPAEHDVEDIEPRNEGFLDKLRGGVGTEDPMIVGDVGPTDIPPGTDGGTTPLVTTDEPVDHLEV